MISQPDTVVDICSYNSGIRSGAASLKIARVPLSLNTRIDGCSLELGSTLSLSLILFMRPLKKHQYIADVAVPMSRSRYASLVTISSSFSRHTIPAPLLMWRVRWSLCFHLFGSSGRWNSPPKTLLLLLRNVILLPFACSIS